MIKLCSMESHSRYKRCPFSAGLEPGTVRAAGQRLSNCGNWPRNHSKCGSVVRYGVCCVLLCCIVVLCVVSCRVALCCDVLRPR